MKHKRWFALMLTAVIMASAWSVTAFAVNETEPETGAAAEKSAVPETEADKESTAPETEADKKSTAPETEEAKESSEKKSHKGHRHEKVAEPENAVGKQAAKDAALADAGVSAEAVGKVKARVSQLEDGTVVYKVSFTYGDQWYSYKIDALTGKILDKTTEDAAAHEAAKAEHKKEKDAEASQEGTEESETGKHRHHGGKHRSGGENAQGTENGTGEKKGTGEKPVRPGTGKKPGTTEPATEESSGL